MDLSRFSTKRIKWIYTYSSSIFIAIESFFLIFNIVLKLLNASRDSIFVVVIYALADVFKAPFYQAFPVLEVFRDSEVDTVGILAFFAYLSLYILGLVIVFLLSGIVFEVDKRHPHIPMYYIERIWELKTFKTWAAVRDAIEMTRKQGYDLNLANKMLKKVMNLEDIGQRFPDTPEELSKIINQGESEDETRSVRDLID